MFLFSGDHGTFQTICHSVFLFAFAREKHCSPSNPPRHIGKECPTLLWPHTCLVLRKAARLSIQPNLAPILSCVNHSADNIKPTQFMLEMANVPKRQQRVACMLLKRTLNEERDQLRSTFKVISSACVEVMQSQRLAGLLRIILYCGNKLNQVCV